jgi:hypothetical protein
LLADGQRREVGLGSKTTIGGWRILWHTIPIVWLSSHDWNRMPRNHVPLIWTLPEVAFDAALGPIILGTALGAAEAFTRLLNAESRNTGLEDLADLAVADDTEAVIQGAGGHGSSCQGACCCNSMKGNHVHIFKD